MRKGTQAQENRNNKSTRLLSALFTVSFLIFGTVSCNQGGNGSDENEIREEEYATEGVDVNNEIGNAENELATNEVVREFQNWDTNEDRQWDQKEFETAAKETGFFDEWDTVDDNALTTEELYEGVFSTYDVDNDNYFDGNEFSTWNTAWGGDYNYDAWDTSDDKLLDNDEFVAGLNDEEVFDEWDKDGNGVYAENEVIEGLYNTWDKDNDGYISNGEYSNIGYDVWEF